jgi:organic radical activating enzyme
MTMEMDMIEVNQNRVAGPAMDTLPVMEHFYTIQGEGFHQGKAAYFIRLAGCDVGCVWCDVRESWDVDAHPRIAINELLKATTQTPAQIVVVTGGEPLMHDLTLLTRQLKVSGYRTHIETSGAYPLSGEWDWICVSPKKFKASLASVLAKADELKVIVFNRSDFDWAEKHRRQVRETCRLYLQPEWGKAGEMTPLIIEYIKAHPEWELSLQIHKYIHVP